MQRKRSVTTCLLMQACRREVCVFGIVKKQTADPAPTTLRALLFTVKGQHLPLNAMGAQAWLAQWCL